MEALKLAFFNDFVPGVIKGERVVDISEAVSSIPHTFPQELLNGLITSFGDYKQGIEALVE